MTRAPSGGPGRAPSGEPARQAFWTWGVVGVLAAGVVAHALVLWAIFVPAPHTGGDNAAYLSLAQDLASGAGYVESWDPARPLHAKYPPAFAAVLAIWMALGAGTWTAFKLLSAGLMVGAGALVFVWARARVGTVPAAAITVLSVGSAGWLEASRWILSEPLFLVALFAALWAADRAVAQPPASNSRGALGWWLLVGGAALLAVFTRTAGLPLLVAGFLLLGFRRAWPGLGVALAVSAIPVTLWVLRGRSGGEGAYQSEFWMANPYDPSLGTVGPLGIVIRVWVNLKLYVGRVLGMEWWGAISAPSWALAALGLALTGAALGGWGLRLWRREVGLAEIFVPLYAGLILIWPEVWSGDRFILPLYPLLLVWATEGFRALPIRPTPRFALGLVWVLALALPMVPQIQTRAEGAAVCRRLGAADPFACNGPAFQGFRDAAAWAGVNLPDGAVVLNRKPRIFYVLGGTPGRVFPFSPAPAALLSAADALGARYLLVDQVDGLSMAYLPSVVSGAPGAFCYLEAWGRETVLLGILSPEDRDRPVHSDAGIPDCPPGFLREGAPYEAPRWGHRVPILRKDSGV